MKPIESAPAESGGVAVPSSPDAPAQHKGIAYPASAGADVVPSSIHELKTLREPWCAVLAGFKRFEFRKNDRDFKCGDVLRLRGWDPEAESYVLGSIDRVVTYIVHGPSFGVPEGYCVMSIDYAGCAA